jgi:tRNA threonylcarbamoyl adenosine modification protein (Sua5/YciO/YrdC/YwlC family)
LICGSNDLLIKVYDSNPPKRAIGRAVEALNNDGIIVFPTDTIYAFGCSLKSKKAMRRIYQIKEMDAKTPLSFIAPDLSDISNYAHVDNFAYRILNKNLPGPFTFLLPANQQINKMMLHKRNEVGFRVPRNNICQTLSSELGYPILSTSVPLWGDVVLNNGELIEKNFRHDVDVVLDEGTLISEPSTIVRISKLEVEIVREGKGKLLL